MLNKNLLFSILFLFLTVSIQGQDCNLSIKGQVFDEATGLHLSSVNVLIQELSQGTITDDKGSFSISNICVGDYHLLFSHIGCETKKIHLTIAKDTVVNVTLSHTVTSLGAIVIKGKKNVFIGQPSISLNRKTMEDNTNKNLSGLLENEVGLSLLKNGSGIAKPIVHGLYGNRLTILNNGIVQGGQQWGNDHSPEIDPFASDKITVLKGVSAVEYGGGNLGSMILVSSKSISKEPHLHGQVNYAYESNGSGQNLNTRFEKYSPLLAWRVNGSLRKYGDRKTPNYYLNNTGVEEISFSLQLEKSWKEKLFLNVYGSTFNTQLGILKGSHIGNLTDLRKAFEREIPFFTVADFSYAIDAPKQYVSHHLGKIEVKYLIDEQQTLEFVLGGQLNNRKEFDVRRSGRTEIPALSLLQYTFNSDIKYTRLFDDDWTFKVGNQTLFIDNTNNPETDILPLIPDYFSWKSGAFTTLSKRTDKAYFQMGVRYDFEEQQVAAISNSRPREVLRYHNQFHNLSGLFAIHYNITNRQSVSFNTGYTMRNPAINELYSNGLHQGVSAIEEGNIHLKTEKGFKNTLEYKWHITTNFSLNALMYHQHFKDYIFLNPQDERLTIRGAFPVFQYEQTNADIYGWDFSSQFTMSDSFFGVFKYSYIKGEDIKNDIPLIFMPSNNLFGSLTYQLQRTLKLFQNIRLEDSEIEINNRFVFEQKNILSSQDFILPPDAYNLFGLKAATNFIFPNYKIRSFVKVDNLFNVRYRDYLNRQRYFSDAIGISVTVGINFKF